MIDGVIYSLEMYPSNDIGLKIEALFALFLKKTDSIFAIDHPKGFMP